MPESGRDTTVVLARHGQTEWNMTGRIQGQEDSPLTELGREQSLRVARRMGRRKIDAIYASPTGRARYLGELMAAQYRRLPFAVVEGLQERSYGCYEGWTLAEVKAQDAALAQRWLADPDREQLATPGGETQAEMSRRVMAALHEILLHHPGSTVAIATHAGPIRSVVFAILGISTTRWDQVMVAPGSLTTILGSSDRLRVVSLNDTSHLEPSGAVR
jgi:broad specificity phosphatase PhoE